MTFRVCAHLCFSISIFSIIATPNVRTLPSCAGWFAPGGNPLAPPGSAPDAMTPWGWTALAGWIIAITGGIWGCTALALGACGAVAIAPVALLPLLG